MTTAHRPIRLPLSVILFAMMSIVALVAFTISAIVGRGNELGYHKNADGLYVTGEAPKHGPTKAAAAAPGAAAPSKQAAPTTKAATDDESWSEPAKAARLDANLARWYATAGRQAYELGKWTPGPDGSNLDVSEAVSYWLDKEPLGVVDVVHGADRGPLSLAPVGDSYAVILKDGQWCETTGSQRRQHVSVQLPGKSNTQALWISYRYYVPSSGTDNNGVWVVWASNQTPSDC